LLTGSDGSHRRLVQVNHDGWARGAQVWPQVSPRPLQFAMSMVSPFVLNINAEFAALMAGSLDDRRRAYADPDWRARARSVWTGRGFGTPDWTKYTIVESTKHPELVDRTVADLAPERGTDPFDTLLDLTLDEPDLGLRVLAVFRNDDADEVAKLLVDEHCTLGLSDAGAHVGQLCDAPEPTDFLGNWVRDRSLMPIETAVRKLTGIHADFLGLTDRGYLHEGMCADVVVFDPETVAPGPLRRVRDFPANAERLTADQPAGIRHVVVNGTAVQVDGAPAAADARAGQVVRVPPRPA
jgi:N-acyl-D-aspartate/D-glutamate deacylase